MTRQMRWTKPEQVKLDQTEPRPRTYAVAVGRSAGIASLARLGRFGPLAFSRKGRQPGPRIGSGSIRQFSQSETHGRTSWRRGRDSNPRYGYPYAAFRVRCFQPLSHLSEAAKKAQTSCSAAMYPTRKA